MQQSVRRNHFRQFRRGFRSERQIKSRDDELRRQSRFAAKSVYYPWLNRAHSLPETYYLAPCAHNMQYQRLAKSLGEFGVPLCQLNLLLNVASAQTVYAAFAYHDNTPVGSRRLNPFQISPFATPPRMPPYGIHRIIALRTRPAFKVDYTVRRIPIMRVNI